MKYFIPTIIIVFFFASCKKEPYTAYEAYLINKSGHIIEIRPYFNGTAPAANTIRLQINDTFKIAEGSDRGLISASDGGFSSKYLSGEDSIRVIFDNTYFISHYVKAPLMLAPKYYLYTSLRNLGNYKSYSAASNNLSKTSRLNIYRYTFTEQDYLDTR